MASHLCETVCMPSQHAEPAHTIRADADLWSASQQALNGREMRAFVVACLTALTIDGAALLAVVEPHWPDPKPRGRPRS